MSELYNFKNPPTYNQLQNAVAAYVDGNLWRAIKGFRKLGWTDRQISKEFGVDPSVISRKFGKGRGK